MSASTSRPVLVLVRDLIFSSRIAATARAVNVEIKQIRDPSRLASESGGLLIADLNQPEVIEAAARWIAATGGSAIGFVSHVDIETSTRAREKGIQVLARSQFVNELESILSPR